MSNEINPTLAFQTIARIMSQMCGADVEVTIKSVEEREETNTISTTNRSPISQAKCTRPGRKARAITHKGEKMGST